MRRSWTIAELERLESLYWDHTAAECAAIFGRTAKAIYGAITTYGFEKQARIPIDRKFRATVRRLNREGWPDQEIAAHLGCERHTVSRHRRAMGLPSKARSGRYRDRVREKTQAQCRAAGVDSLGELRALTFRIRSLRAGWPVDLRPRHVEMLDLLERRGPMTRREIADALGMPWKGSRWSLKSNDAEGSYLAHLIRRGLVVDLGRINRVTGRGKGYSTHVYALAIGAERRKVQA